MKIFFAKNTVKQLMSTTQPKKIEPIKRLRQIYKQKRITWKLKSVENGVIETQTELLEINKDDAYHEYKSALHKYYDLKEHLLGLTYLSDMKFLANVIRSGVTNVNRDYVYCRLDRYFSEKSIPKNYNIIILI
jgi:hypothetical protein